MGPRSPAGKEGRRVCPVLPAGPTFPNAAAWRPLPEEQRDSRLRLRKQETVFAFRPGCSAGSGPPRVTWHGQAAQAFSAIISLIFFFFFFYSDTGDNRSSSKSRVLVTWCRDTETG